MNFEDETYVRLYVRDTKTWLRLGFEGQCVLMFLLRKLDKAGVLDGMDDLDSDVSLVTGVPQAIVAAGMPRLLKWGVFQQVGNRLVMPNYLTAQSAIRTDKARQRDMREKRLSQARLVTPRDDGVTPCDEISREPTAGHAASRGVTLSCTDLHSADLISTELHSAGDPERAREPEPPSSPEHTQIRPIGSGGVARTYSMPSKEPTAAYLEEATLRGVHAEQAKSTWEYYFGAGLPERGVERLYEWLLQRAKERANSQARAGPRGRSTERGDVMAMLAERREKHLAEEAAEEAAKGVSR